MVRIYKVYIVILPVVLAMAIGVNSQIAIARPRTGFETPNSPDYPYPDPINPSTYDIREEDFGGLETRFPYPFPELESTPSSNLDISNPHQTFLPLIQRALLTYNRTSAVGWADQWAHGRHPCRPNYGSGSSCDDCTNYLSQVLNEGGLPTLFNPASDPSAWWYWCDEFCICTNSNTWSATDWLNSHITLYQGIRYENKISVDYLEAGDFIILDLYSSPVHGIPNHARVILGWGYPQEGDMFGNYLLLANQRCTDRHRVHWDYNLTGNDLKWYWHVRNHPSQ